MPAQIPVTLAAALLLASAAAPPPKAPARTAAARPISKTAPLPAGAGVAWSHSPYEAGDCSICHARNDRKDPGPIAAKSVNELCATCHDEVQAMQKAKVLHPAAEDACTNCHNPHNAKRRKLLVADLVELCASCHDAVGKVVAQSAVKHGAVTAGERCLTCHDPHAAANAKLLVRPAYELCLDCHSKDDVPDWDGKPLANIGGVLKQNAYWHEPIRARDCTSCHSPHGAANPRLLAEAYPTSFYAPFEPKRYGLCFQCHDEKAFTTPETETLTSFRDGKRNLHSVHVNQKRGRTCRTCHEVHASTHVRLIRGSVPYGPRKWDLQVGYERLPTGGACAKTCHEKKSYHYYRAAQGAPTR